LFKVLVTEMQVFIPGGFKTQQAGPVRNLGIATILPDSPNTPNLLDIPRCGFLTKVTLGHIILSAHLSLSFLFQSAYRTAELNPKSNNPAPSIFISSLKSMALKTS